MRCNLFAVPSPRVFLAIALIPVMALVSISARAATITVSNAGTDAPNCGAAISPCKTINHALAVASNSDTIDVVAGQYAETLVVSKSVMITGPSSLQPSSPVVIVGVGTNRVFTINKGVTVSLSHLTIQNAKSTADGAAIANLGTLMVSYSTIQNSSLGKFGHEKCQPCAGGGISNQGTMTLTNVLVSGNSANGGGSGGTGIVVFSHPADVGGGIYNSGNLTVTDSTIKSNIAGSSGGGIFNAIGGTVIIGDSTISKNTGGGIANAGDLSVAKSTIAQNTSAQSSGGGITNAGHLSVLNSTIGQNTGGGITNVACDPQANTKTTATLTFTTVAYNDAGLTNLPVGVINTESRSRSKSRSETSCTQSMELVGSIVANSTVVNCATVPAAPNNSYVTSDDYNLDSGGTCGFHQPHDLSNAIPRLSQQLAPNSPVPVPIPAPPVVPTDTYALLSGSPAIDAGGTRLKDCPGADQRGVSRPPGKACDCPATDQRGVSRPQGKACDIGSYELIQ